jgi:23S rRNA (uracil1939-C5)-methyltransferase
MGSAGVRPDADAERREWVIEKVVPGGDGMARLADGRVAFATGAMPADVIRPVAVEAKKGHVRASRWTLVSPAPERVTPPCPVAEACGGCDWMMMSRPAQLVSKEHLLREALARTGGFADVAVTVTAVGDDLRYRSRVRFHVDGSGRIGFFARGSHLLVEIPGCLVCRPEIDAALAALRRVPKDTLAAFSEIEVRVADTQPNVVVLLVPRVAGAADPAVRVVATTCGTNFLVVAADAASREGTEQRYDLPGGVRLLAEPGVFTQVNWPVNAALVQAVVDGAREREVGRFLDAYAGAGNFTLPLLALGLRGVSVERDARAVADARRSAHAQGFAEDGFVVGAAEAVVAELARRGEDFDFVLLDPPRSGARDVLESVSKLEPRVIACCSCDPVTLARDLRYLAGRGYQLRAVRGFDMFPSTHHLETLAWMQKP